MPATEIIWTLGATSDYLTLAHGSEELEDLLEHVLSLLLAFPGHGQTVETQNTLRRVFVGRRRHVGLFYSHAGHRIVIAALVDLRQDPKAIEKLLKQRIN